MKLIYNQNDKFYGSAKWKKTRERILRRDAYLDQIEKRYGRMKEAHTVHHIIPRERHPEYQWCEWNLISISHKTHEALHIRETGELSKKGIDLVYRVCKKQGIEIPIEYKKDRIRAKIKRKPTYY